MLNFVMRILQLKKTLSKYVTYLIRQWVKFQTPCCQLLSPDYLQMLHSIICQHLKLWTVCAVVPGSSTAPPGVPNQRTLRSLTWNGVVLVHNLDACLQIDHRGLCLHTKACAHGKFKFCFLELYGIFFFPPENFWPKVSWICGKETLRYGGLTIFLFSLNRNNCTKWLV